MFLSTKYVLSGSLGIYVHTQKGLHFELNTGEGCNIIRWNVIYFSRETGMDAEGDVS